MTSPAPLSWDVSFGRRSPAARPPETHHPLVTLRCWMYPSEPDYIQKKTLENQLSLGWVDWFWPLLPPTPSPHRAQMGRIFPRKKTQGVEWSFKLRLEHSWGRLHQKAQSGISYLLITLQPLWDVGSSSCCELGPPKVRLSWSHYRRCCFHLARNCWT